MSTTRTSARTRSGCRNCRQRHLKCDERRPSCVRCHKLGKQCIRELNVRFRHSANPSVKSSWLETPELKFSESQPWVELASDLVFSDGTEQIKNLYGHGQSSLQATTSALPSDGEPSPSPLSRSSENETDRSSKSVLHETIPAPHPGTDVAKTSEWQEWSTDTQSQAAALTPQSPDDPIQSGLRTWHTSNRSEWIESGDGQLASSPSDQPSSYVLSAGHSSLKSPVNISKASSSHNSCGTSSSRSPNTLSAIYLNVSVWPLACKEEAKLLRYYVERLAREFDLTDPDRHFRCAVPLRAATCPLLLNAILALSARHLSRVGDYDPLVSNKYHQECLERVAPILNDSAALLDENLLASTIILRHLEEYEMPLSPPNSQTYLLGSHTLLQAQRYATREKGLRQAAFWVGLRQEIYAAFVNQRPVGTTFQSSTIDWSYQPPGDHGWSCKMVVLCADVMHFCFRDNGRSTDEHDSLCSSVAEWHTGKSPSFNPIYYSEPDEESVFPDIWLLNDEVIVGLQHYYIAKILLCAYNPRVPCLGPGRSSALLSEDERIKDYVRTLCGIAISNPDTATNFTYASMAIAAAGDKFTEEREQEALLNVLEICDSHYAFPTGHCGDDLKTIWGWNTNVVWIQNYSSSPNVLD